MLHAPQADYTRALLAAVPRLQPHGPRRTAGAPVMLAKRILKSFGTRTAFGAGRKVQALAGSI